MVPFLIEVLGFSFTLFVVTLKHFQYWKPLPPSFSVLNVVPSKLEMCFAPGVLKQQQLESA